MAKTSRSTLFVLAILLFGLAVHSAPVPVDHGISLSQPFGPGIHKTYRLSGQSNFPGNGWNGSNPGPLLTADDGDNVTVMLKSADGIPHSWFIDLNGNNLLDSNEAATRSPDFSTSSWVNFTFTTALGSIFPHGGTFRYMCQQHPGQMFGYFRFNAGPLASFTHSPPTPLVGHTVSFDGSMSWPSTNATITNFTWDFADGNTASSGSRPTITHAYLTNKTFTVVLTVTDNMSQTAQVRGNVTVLNPPPVPFDYQLTILPANATIFEGHNTTALVSLSLVSGSTENVSLASPVLPLSVLQVRLNVTSGFPSFHAALSIIAGSANGIYTITVTTISATGVAHNATLTLRVVALPTPPPTPPPNYLFYAVIGAIAAIGVLAVFLFYRRRSNSKLRD